MLGFIVPQWFPPVGVAVPGDRADAGEWHVVGLDEEVVTALAI